VGRRCGRFPGDYSERRGARTVSAPRFREWVRSAAFSVGAAACGMAGGNGHCRVGRRIVSGDLPGSCSSQPARHVLALHRLSGLPRFLPKRLRVSDRRHPKCGARILEARVRHVGRHDPLSRAPSAFCPLGRPRVLRRRLSARGHTGLASHSSGSRSAVSHGRAESVPLGLLGIGSGRCRDPGGLSHLSLRSVCGVFPSVRVPRHVAFRGRHLLAGVFVGRHYCRFLCPYGILLGLFARVSRYKVSVTPDVCIRCGLCHDTCPFDAIRPSLPRRRESKRLTGDRRGVLLSLPLILAAVGFALGPLLAPSPRFTGTIAAIAAGIGDSRAYRIAGTLLGAFLGVVLLAKLMARNHPANRDEYEATAAECVACGRCFDSCPRERFRRGEIGEAEAASLGDRSSTFDPR